MADLFAANAKCHFYFVFYVDDCDNRKGSSPVKLVPNGSVTVIVFYATGLEVSLITRCPDGAKWPVLMLEVGQTYADIEAVRNGKR